LRLDTEQIDRMMVNALDSASLTKTKKLRLNANQWQTLQSLAEDGMDPSTNGQSTVTGRLTSHGLVATDRQGCACLTIFGLQRLGQGR